MPGFKRTMAQHNFYPIVRGPSPSPVHEWNSWWPWRHKGAFFIDKLYSFSTHSYNFRICRHFYAAAAGSDCDRGSEKQQEQKQQDFPHTHTWHAAGKRAKYQASCIPPTEAEATNKWKVRVSTSHPSHSEVNNSFAVLGNRERSQCLILVIFCSD